jgi:hypothetical protein
MKSVRFGHGEQWGEHPMKLLTAPERGLTLPDFPRKLGAWQRNHAVKPAIAAPRQKPSELVDSRYAKWMLN